MLDNPMTFAGYCDDDVLATRCPICGVLGADTVYKNTVTGDITGCDNCVKPYDPEDVLIPDYESERAPCGF